MKKINYLCNRIQLSLYLFMIVYAVASATISKFTSGQVTSAALISAGFVTIICIIGSVATAMVQHQAFRGFIVSICGYMFLGVAAWLAVADYLKLAGLPWDFTLLWPIYPLVIICPAAVIYVLLHVAFGHILSAAKKLAAYILNPGS